MQKYYEKLNNIDPFKEKPQGYLTDDELIKLLNSKNIKIERKDNLPRFANNNNIKMSRLVRVGSAGSTPTIYLKPTETKLQEIFQNCKNNNTSLIGAEFLEKKKKKILEIFDAAPSAQDYEDKISKIPNRKEKQKLRDIKWNKCYTTTKIAAEVTKLLNVNCNRKLVSSVLKKSRKSQLDKLLKKPN
ncbi:hypothetical protein [Candidatus Pelagibacter communis]|uniref:hypothetical protein n=1 Tax=Pelagibacter ubique TaxID=198252 RepID=UPI00094D83EC|nr:hypothetical protein [Candidatus Pelagibacter ubique]